MKDDGKFPVVLRARSVAPERDRARRPVLARQMRTFATETVVLDTSVLDGLLPEEKRVVQERVAKVLKEYLESLHTIMGSLAIDVPTSFGTLRFNPKHEQTMYNVVWS